MREMTGRRRVLALVAGSVLASAPGCADRFSDDGPGVCEAPVVFYANLPEQAQAEVDSAIEDGTFETNDELLFDAITESEPDILVNPGSRNDPEMRLHYKTAVSSSTGDTRLTVTRFDGRPERLDVDNQTDEAVSVSVEVRTSDDEELVSAESVDVQSQRSDELRGVFPEYGRYELTIRTNGMSTSTDVEHEPEAFASNTPRVQIHESDIEYRPVIAEPSIPEAYDCPGIWGTR